MDRISVGIISVWPIIDSGHQSLGVLEWSHVDGKVGLCKNIWLHCLLVRICRHEHDVAATGDGTIKWCTDP